MHKSGDLMLSGVTGSGATTSLKSLQAQLQSEQMAFERKAVLSAAGLTELPVLPEGWLYTIGHAYGDRIIHIECPDRGAMSIDFKYRCFSTGWRNPDRLVEMRRNMPAEAGRRHSLQMR